MTRELTKEAIKMLTSFEGIALLKSKSYVWEEN